MTNLSIIQEFYQSGIHTLKRFPFTILFVFLVCGCIVYGFQVENWTPTVIALMMAGTYGVFLALLLHIARERYGGGLKASLSGYILLFALVAFIIYYWKGIIVDDHFSISSAAIYSGSLVLLTLMVAIVPYIRSGVSNQSLLTYNRRVFTFYIFSALLSLIAYAALSLALLAIDNLFDISIPGKTYMHLLTLIGGVVWTFLFLSNFPVSYDSEDAESYPAFRVIIQFIGIPVIVVYALILLFYALKNVMGDDSHEEWTLWLILWFYLLSFLIFCLNYSIKKDTGHRWSEWFSKWYLAGAMPICFLNLVGSWKTINANGVTELSFIIATFSLFLLISSIYLLFIKKNDFRLVLGLLFILTLISVFGPWNMCFSAIISQAKQLESRLYDHNMLENGILSPSVNLPAPAHQEIIGLIEFLANRGKINMLKLWDGNNVLGAEPLAIQEVYTVLNLDGSGNISRHTNFIQGRRYQQINIEEFNSLLPVYSPFSMDNIDGMYITFQQSNSYLILKEGSKTIAEMDYSESLDIPSLEKNKYLELEDETHRIKIYFEFIDLDNNNIISNIEGIALYQNKQTQ